MDRTAVLQHCVDLQDWFTAGHLCMLDDRHVQVGLLSTVHSVYLNYVLPRLIIAMSTKNQKARHNVYLNYLFPGKTQCLPRLLIARKNGVYLHCLFTQKNTVFTYTACLPRKTQCLLRLLVYPEKHSVYLHCLFTQKNTVFT